MRVFVYERGVANVAVMATKVAELQRESAQTVIAVVIPHDVPLKGWSITEVFARAGVDLERNIVYSRTDHREEWDRVLGALVWHEAVDVICVMK